MLGRLIMERELDPCIVFSFSKKECETYALQMSRFVTLLVPQVTRLGSILIRMMKKC